MSAAARFHGPFTKKDGTPPKGKPPEAATQQPRQVGGYDGLSARFPQHVLLQGDPSLASKLPKKPEISFPIGLPADRSLMDSSREDQRRSGTFHEVVPISPRPQDQHGGIDQHSLSLLLDFTQVCMEEVASGSSIGRVQNEEDRVSVNHPAVGFRQEEIERTEREQYLLGPQKLSRSLLDLTRVNPRIIKLALRVFQEAIIRNGYRAIGCALPSDGRVILIQVDISTRKKQLQALELCQQWKRFIEGGQRGVLPPIQTEPPLGIIEPPDARGMDRQLPGLEASRPATHSEDKDLMEDVVMVADPLYRLDRSMVVRAAAYDVEAHGENGCRMKQKLYTSLFGEYTRLLREKMQANPMTKLEQIEAVRYLSRSKEDHLLMWVLHYLLRKDSQSSLHVTVSGEEARYWDFINAHEVLMSDYQGKEETYNPDVIAWSRAIAEARMTPRIQSYQESLVAAHYEALPDMTAKTFHQAFAMRNEALRNADSRMKLWAGWREATKFKGSYTLEDYFGMNPPNLRKVEEWTKGQDESREIFYLRHSTPHSGSNFLKSSINLTYQEFLRQAESKGQAVIYAVHQRVDEFMYNCSPRKEYEGYRVQSIIDLESDHRNLLVLGQSVESDLFKKGKKTFTELKEAILDSFRQKNTACRNRLPHFLVEDQGDSFAIKRNYEAELRGILDLVQRVFFPTEEDAIPQEKVDCYGGLKKESYLTSQCQAFIMLFYHFQREHLKFADLSDYGYCYQVKYVNSGCKDDYDRGGGQNGTTDRVHQHQVYGADVSRLDLEATLSSIQAPPIQGKGVPAIEYRLHPALFVSWMLANLSERQLQELQAVKWNGWSLAGYDVGRRDGQTAV